MDQRLDELSAIVGAPVVAAARGGWGFENHTTIATLADGRRLVVQQLASRASASYKLGLAAVLPPRIVAVGIRAPLQLAAHPEADPPYALREYIPGQAGAAHMGVLAGVIAIARAMGRLLPRLASVDPTGIDIDRGWATPEGLAARAQRWLANRHALLDTRIVPALETTIADLPARFAGRAPVFAHGDFCPVNVLVDESTDWRPEADDAPQALGHQSPALRVVGLLDFEFARLADALFDAAWWGWVVRYHHPERWVFAWPHLLESAGIAPDAGNLARVQALQRLRCLEMVDYHAGEGRLDAALMWAERLAVTLGWD